MPCYEATWMHFSCMQTPQGLLPSTQAHLLHSAAHAGKDTTLKERGTKTVTHIPGNKTLADVNQLKLRRLCFFSTFLGSVSGFKLC